MRQVGLRDAELRFVVTRRDVHVRRELFELEARVDANGDAHVAPRGTRARIEGFIIIDYFPRLGEFAAEMAKWVAEGKVKYDVHIVKGIENALSALNLLFTGGNTGKLLLQMSEEP